MMKPPRYHYPNIPHISIHRRMGPGEDCRDAFDTWYKSLDAKHRELYRKENPEPEGWDEFYAFKESHLDSWK